ncbi:MAG TPA: hypothetical protein VD913_01525, partial [bacterium]|nr:hypothetical protein [bacterium]
LIEALKMAEEEVRRIMGLNEQEIEPTDNEKRKKAVDQFESIGGNLWQDLFMKVQSRIHAMDPEDGSMSSRSREGLAGERVLNETDPSAFGRELVSERRRLMAILDQLAEIWHDLEERWNEGGLELELPEGSEQILDESLIRSVPDFNRQLIDLNLRVEQEALTGGEDLSELLVRRFGPELLRLQGGYERMKADYEALLKRELGVEALPSPEEVTNQLSGKYGEARGKIHQTFLAIPEKLRVLDDRIHSRSELRSNPELWGHEEKDTVVVAANDQRLLNVNPALLKIFRDAEAVISRSGNPLGILLMGGPARLMALQMFLPNDTFLPGLTISDVDGVLYVQGNPQEEVTSGLQQAFAVQLGKRFDEIKENVLQDRSSIDFSISRLKIAEIKSQEGITEAYRMTGPQGVFKDIDEKQLRLVFPPDFQLNEITPAQTEGYLTRLLPFLILFSLGGFTVKDPATEAFIRRQFEFSESLLNSAQERDHLKAEQMVSRVMNRVLERLIASNTLNRFDLSQVKKLIEDFGGSAFYEKAAPVLQSLDSSAARQANAEGTMTDPSSSDEERSEVRQGNFADLAGLSSENSILELSENIQSRGFEDTLSALEQRAEIRLDTIGEGIRAAGNIILESLRSLSTTEALAAEVWKPKFGDLVRSEMRDMPVDAVEVDILISRMQAVTLGLEAPDVVGTRAEVRIDPEKVRAGLFFLDRPDVFTSAYKEVYGRDIQINTTEDLIVHLNLLFNFKDPSKRGRLKQFVMQGYNRVGVMAPIQNGIGPMLREFTQNSGGKITQLPDREMTEGLVQKQGIRQPVVMGPVEIQLDENMKEKALAVSGDVLMNDLNLESWQLIRLLTLYRTVPELLGKLSQTTDSGIRIVNRDAVVSAFDFFANLLATSKAAQKALAAAA